MWTTVLVCAAIFTFMINFWIQTRQAERDRQEIRNEEWSRQSRINALYGKDTYKESNVEEK